jgi:predicted RNA-binding Zn ribbon-like protein
VRDHLARARTHRLAGRYDLAERELRVALRQAERAPGRALAERADAASALGVLLQELGRPADAHAVLRLAIAGYEQIGGPADPRLVEPLSALGAVCRLRGELAQAERCCQRAVVISTSPSIKPSSPRYWSSATTLVTKGGGVVSSAPGPDQLELAGNALCLDFANTVNARPTAQRDYLTSYADLVAWSVYAGALPASEVELLQPQGSRRAAEAVLADAQRLRDTVYAVFSAIVADRRPERSEVERLGEAYAGALANVRIATRVGASSLGDRGPAYELTWPVHAGQFDAPLWPVAHSAGELLLSGPLERVGECPSCGWLFLDTSRNGTRRWCSMATCGSRDKMARYHRRRRG